jgi:hypothetical protein
VLLWRRSDNICFALLLGSGEGVSVGEAVECQVQGILQARFASCMLRWYRPRAYECHCGVFG